MRALTAATTAAVLPSLTKAQVDARDLLLMPMPAPRSGPCIVCRDPEGVRCCEYGRA